jgi:hypothetical protein
LWICSLKLYKVFWSSEFEFRTWLGILDITFCDKVYQLHAAGLWFSHIFFYLWQIIFKIKVFPFSLMSKIYLKWHCRHKLFFFWRFQGQEGVHIMHHFNFENYLPQVKEYILVANNLVTWLIVCIENNCFLKIKHYSGAVVVMIIW